MTIPLDFALKCVIFHMEGNSQESSGKPCFVHNINGLTMLKIMYHSQRLRWECKVSVLECRCAADKIPYTVSFCFLPQGTGEHSQLC